VLLAAFARVWAAGETLLVDWFPGAASRTR